jgi:hypothetical protein
MRLLFESLTTECLTQERIQKFKDWVKKANKARENSQLERRANQYDKAEELITYYVFAPLLLRENSGEMVQEILRLANIQEHVEGESKLRFEAQLSPPNGYLRWLQTDVLKHPVKYVREQARDHIERGKPLETNTHVDVLIESENLLILVEMKFTSDISAQTTFNPRRNQLARLVDVGISEAQKKKDRRLAALVCSPSESFLSKSRLYFYKIQDYSNFEEVKKDIKWREQKEIVKYVSAVAWVPLEKVISIIYKDFNHPDMKAAMGFFKERNLVQL